MRGLKVWANILRRRFTVWLVTAGSGKSERSLLRRRRLESIRGLKEAMTSDILNRHKLEEITIRKEDLEKIKSQNSPPSLLTLEKIYRESIQ
jgi:hypothetical protein